MSTDGPIYRKYDVRRVDGTDQPGGKHDGCALFVLDVTHDPFAREAALFYANCAQGTHPQLAGALRQLVYAAMKQDGGGAS